MSSDHNLTKPEVQELASELIKQIQAQHHEFWIDPEHHYKQHIALNEMLEDYKKARGLFWKVFITIIGAGAAVLAGIAVIKSKLFS